MLTPQEVSSKTFPKAVMGGYGMASVDEFLDRLTEDYTSLFQENAALKNKIKQLGDKIEEYRKVDDTMRATLLAAQKMADEIVSQAEAKRDAALKEVEQRRMELMGDAEQTTRRRLEELAGQVAAEERRLQEKKDQVDAAIAAEDYRLEKSRNAVRKFMEIARGNCQEQLKILSRLEEMVPPPPRREEPPAAPAAPAQPVQPVWQQPESPPAPEAVRESAPPLDAVEPAEEEPFSLPEGPGDGEEDEVVDETFFTSPLPSISHLRSGCTAGRTPAAGSRAGMTGRSRRASAPPCPRPRTRSRDPLRLRPGGGHPDHQSGRPAVWPQL